MALCGGGGGDGSEELRRQEEERQRRIMEGTNRINQIFGGEITIPDGTTPVNTPSRGVFSNLLAPAAAVLRTRKETVPGQFTDDYFSNLEREYNDFYLPQLQRQEDDADRATRIRLARSGNLTGSVGARDLGRLEEDKATARRSVIDSGIKYGADARSKIEQTRGNLIGQLESGAGVENVANQARAAAEAATAPPAFSPLGDLFKNYTAALMNSSVAAGNPNAFPGADQYRRSLLFNIPKPGDSSSSAITVP